MFLIVNRLGLKKKVRQIMKTVLYKSWTRGHKNQGWLDTYHTFSFADYYDPERMHFGALRVINDDVIEGRNGFDFHPHDNMEIVSIPLFGELEHKDNIGHRQIIRVGEVQTMSAGSGIKHSEYNPHPDQLLNLLQIWVYPNKENVKPRYDQQAFSFKKTDNKLVQIVSPSMADNNLWIHQDAWFSLGTFKEGHAFTYKPKKPGNGVWLMVIEGEFSVADQKLYRRDGLGVWDTDDISVTADSDKSCLLLIDVPMAF